ncbi:hypothetical protein GCM10027037_33470 [Mucilaginibacter koreensis]
MAGRKEKKSLNRNSAVKPNEKGVEASVVTYCRCGVVGRKYAKFEPPIKPNVTAG